MTLKRWEKAGRIKPSRLGPRVIRFTLAYVLELEKNGIPS